MVKKASFYNYLNQSGCITLDGVDDANKFDALRLAFEVVQIPPDLIEGILSVMSSILWLGNLTFADTDHEVATIAGRVTFFAEKICSGTISLETVCPETVCPETVCPETICPVTVCPEAVCPETVCLMIVCPETVCPDTICPEQFVL